ncbi:unnamed protein product, partial [Brenthis ino]
MTSTDILPLYISKLSHPMKEIRERALQLLLAKFRLGWELEDELAGTRTLLESLLAWFDTQEPSMQQEALELLVITVKTKSGTYIAKEFGIDKMLNNLNEIKNKIKGKALEILEDLVETLNFLNTVDSQVNITVPPLKLNSETSSCTNASSNCYYNITENSSEESFVANVAKINVNDESTKDGIVILLYPWVELSSSDLKTIILIGDSLKVLKSTRRCCRFIRNVFLRDFPVEIFLNRPTIVKTLLAIADGQCGGHPAEALQTLLCITQSLHSRFYTLFSLDFVCQSYKIADDNRNCEDNVNAELEQFASLSHLPQEDGLVPLRQLPAPLYALETLHTILTIMIRSVVLVDMNQESDILDMKELNICLCLVESLIILLLDCVTERFWSADHMTKTHRDIAHKSCMAMRMLGELTMKYRTSFTQEPDRTHYRVAWLRLVPCGERLLHWARESALPPTALVAALQAAHIDPALELMYPEISKRIASVLFNAKSSIDKEYKSRYKELSKLFVSMDHAMQFMKIKDTNRAPDTILNCIKNGLPILYINLSEKYLRDIGTILLKKLKDFNMNDDNWSIARSICLTLMAHNLAWVQATFYKMLADMVRTTLMGDEVNQADNEKCLTLICDVGILTEICCHGLSSTEKEVEYNANEIMLYVLRGRLALSEGCWWRLLASLLPALPLLHAHAAHDTTLGKAICKSLEADIVECMGVSNAERVAGLVRLLFVNCAPVQLDAAHSVCRLLDDSKYLPPREVLRTDVIMNALRRIKPQDFNIDQSSSPSKNPQTSGLIQIMEVLKQDLTIDEATLEYTGRASRQPALEPSLRRSTLQQLAVLLRQQELHDTFIQYDGLNLIISLLRLSLLVDDYLAFPECAISCVSVLNSVCFKSRHNLAKISDLPLLLLRVILIFPANEDCVVMAAQVLSLVVWAGFALRELASRREVPALPAVVTHRTCLPFIANSYWTTSPNVEHSAVEWLLTDEAWRSAIRVRWWWLHSGGRLVSVPHGTSPPGPAAPSASPASPAPPTPRDLALLRAASLRHSCTNLLLALENATSHVQVYDALNLLECYTYLIQYSPSSGKELEDLPWHHTRRFLSAPPASLRDTTLLISLLQFIVAFMDNTPRDDNAMSWIQSSFIGNDAVIISLLSRDRLYPQQTACDDIEVTQLRIYIVKVVLRCILLVEHRGNYSSSKMESLLKILFTCLDRIDLKNFHVLGYLNELIRCIRYAVYSQYCRISEDTLVQSLRVMTNALSGCASGAGRKGQACRLDAMLALLALLKLIQQQSIPVQRWSDAWGGKAMCAVGACAAAARPALRAAALHAAAALAHHAHLLPHLLQSINEESLSQFALGIFSRAGEANTVRAAAACLLTTVTARISPNTQVS